MAKGFEVLPRLPREESLFICCSNKPITVIFFFTVKALHILPSLEFWKHSLGTSEFSFKFNSN